MASTAVRPAFRSVPDYVLSNGDIAADIGAMVGLPPDPNQRDILDVMFAEARPGRLACFEVAAIAPRQNIKSSTLEVAALTDLFVFLEPLSIWTAHLYKTTRGAFRDMVQRIEACDALRARCKKPTTANGNESIELLTGQRIEFHARSKGGGRGLTARRVTLDEALLLSEAEMGALLPTMATILNSQVRYGSSAGLATSEVLRSVRDRGRSGTDPSLGYLEWCAPPKDCTEPKCSHRFGEAQGCALDDESLWWHANPSLGDRIPLETLQKLRASLPAAEFMREFLGWWEDPTVLLAALPAEAWAACVAPGSQIVGQPVLAMSMTPDRSTVSLVAAGTTAAGRSHVEVVQHGRNGDWFVPKVTEIARRQGAKVIVAPNHPAGALIPALELAGVTVQVVTGAQYVQACGHFYDTVVQQQLAYPSPQPELDAAVARAARKPSGDAWRWSGDDICALVAATQAVWGLTPSAYEERGLVIL